MPAQLPQATSTLPGLANRANAAIAVAAARSLGVDPELAMDAAYRISSVRGRYAVVPTPTGQLVRLLLAKNPAGWTEATSVVAAGQDPLAPVVIAFNAEGVDGRDPSWIYDVDFSSLHDRRVAVVGRRATDMAVRLHLEGLDAVEECPDLLNAVRRMPPGPVEVIANYSAFQDARKALSRG